MRKLLIFLSFVVLTNCTLYSLVEPGRVEIGDTFAVKPDFAWSKVDHGKQETWTIDGLGLQNLQFTKGLEDGDTLYQPHLVKATGALPKFQENMTPLEIKDFVITTSTALGALKIKEKDFRPVKLGTVDAFRTEFTYTMKDGLDREGIAVGFVKKKKLYLITYSGAKLLYFPKHKDDVERLLDSIEIL